MDDLIFFRESSAKGLGTISSSNRSNPIQQTVPVPIALTIPSSSSSSSGTTNNVVSQQQASPLQQFLGPGLSYRLFFFRFIFIRIYQLFKILLYHFVMFMPIHLNFMVHPLVFIQHKIWLTLLPLNKC